ncbi:methionine synthase [Romeria aff. gracilis LEGE 07310]|uniref:Methionine synthase n=1 Tax=Vasconcelosia minhoensis LEGE 07310 TaxID=915328 RepID=A0A8J7A637_9CYAN|nr:Npun_R2821/Npun_R2822 family protein [Romeria gracilis]MBE9076600.1 methionine synthase [Romeria aff. gracilis LEGE 07310]
MQRGIYIVANDRVADNAIALLSSLRRHDPNVPIVLIPFDQRYQGVAERLQRYQVSLFPDLAFLEAFTQKIGEIFPKDFLALPNKMRKLAGWFGPLDDFLYIDTDILFFGPVTETLAYLEQADFICCDYHFKGRGIQDIFSQRVIDDGIFTPEALQDVFNSGLWGSKKGAISLEQMYDLLQDCAQHREYFDFSSGTTDQPIINYLVLKAIPRRLNIAKANPSEPGSWGGSPHFEQRDRRLYDGDRPLRYLHWAGTPMRPGGPYRTLWEYYRYLDDPDARSVETPPIRKSWRQRLSAMLRKAR